MSARVWRACRGNNVAKVSLGLLQSLMQRSVDELAGVRSELGGVRREQAEIWRQNGEMRSMVLLLADQGRRIERKVGDVRDEIGLMVKSEPMGRLGHFDLIEARRDALAPHAA